jgi:hypothetical protein
LGGASILREYKNGRVAVMGPPRARET